ncbi:bleomycin hydrolase [Aeromonas salmonicida]|uniref:bleomycin hydrolase n=1 Tax=Aeromonas salmonicida TaxID=645 RepID=UPI00232DFDFF|nr:bleomycin hydrolase [Aeromonas salmonicida]WCH25173.1 bleomycin hydrolase [Aeromonas salmonicida]
MSYQEFEDAFEEALAKKSWWSRLMGSQFSTGIATFVGQMVERCDFLARRLIQEAFMSTATKRASILAAAEDRGYVGRMISPSLGKARFTNKTTSTVNLSYGTPLTAPNRLHYVLHEAAQLDPGESLVLTVAQLEEKVLTANITAEQKWLELLLTKEMTKSAAKVDVYVTLPRRPKEQWVKRYQFRRADGEAKVYTEFYKPTEQLGVRFGNGLSGKVPPAGSTITLNVWCTEGDSTLIEGQKMELDSLNDALVAGISIVTTTSIVGGAAGESTEDVRKGALYSTAYDEQIVWDNDYRHFIVQNIADLVWLNVWGETAQERESGYSLDNINRIFFSAYSDKKSQAQLETEILALFESNHELNRRYRYVPVLRSPFTITLNGIMNGRQQAEIVRQAMIETLDSAFGEDAVSRKGKDGDATIYEKDIWAVLRELGNVIEFKLSVNNQDRAPLLNEYVFLDAANSTYNLEYKS